MSTCGLATASTMRRVIVGAVHAELGVDAADDDVEPLEQVVVQVERAVLEDVDLHAGEDAERRQLRVEPAITSSWSVRRSRLSPWATVSRGEWSVSTM